jgi:hypothetical protein
MGSLFLGYIVILAPALVALIGCAIAGYLMLARVDRGFVGVLLGFFLGPIGLLIAWPMRDNALRDRDQRERLHELDRFHEPGRLDGLAEPPAPQRSLMHELDALVDQRARGLISAEEYERRKRDVLGA